MTAQETPVDSPMGSPMGSPMDDVARELALLFRSLKGLHHAVLTDLGERVEMPATAVLSTLADRGRTRPSALAELLHLDLSSISRQAAALEREGWVSRERDPDDSRAFLLDLTPAGRAVLDRVRAGRVTQLRRLLPTWSDADLADFAGSLFRFRSALNGALPGAETHSTPETDRTPALAGQETR